MSFLATSRDCYRIQKQFQYHNKNNNKRKYKLIVVSLSTALSKNFTGVQFYIQIISKFLPRSIGNNYAEDGPSPHLQSHAREVRAGQIPLPAAG